MSEPLIIPKVDPGRVSHLRLCLELIINGFLLPSINFLTKISILDVAWGTDLPMSGLYI